MGFYSKGKKVRLTMKIIKQLDKAFIKGFLKDWINLSKNESIALTNRKCILNKNFRFTQPIIQRLRKINDLLRREELRIKEQSLKICAMQENNG